MSSRATFFAILFRRVRPDNVASLRCKLSLLRARRERPRCRAAEQRDEPASSWVEHGLLPGTHCASLQQAQVAPEALAGPWADLNRSESSCSPTPQCACSQTRIAHGERFGGHGDRYTTPLMRYSCAGLGN